MDNRILQVFTSKICPKCGSKVKDLVDTLCENCGHRLVLQISTDDLKTYLDDKYSSPSDLKLNLKEVLAELFPKDLFDYVTFSCLHYLISSGLSEIRSWEDKLEDLRFYAGKTPEEKKELTIKIQNLYNMLEDYADKLQSGLQSLWKKVQQSPLKTKFEEFARVWQKSQEVVEVAPQEPRPEFKEKVLEGLEKRLNSVEETSSAIEKAFPALKSLLMDLLSQLQTHSTLQMSQTNAQISQGLWRSLQELQFIMSLLPQMLQGRDYPHQPVEVYNINALMDYGEGT